MKTFIFFHFKESNRTLFTFRNCLLHLAILIGVFSCSSNIETEMAQLENRSSSSFDFSIYGVKHNDLLDYVTTLSGFDTVSREAIFNYGGTFSSGDFSGATGSWSSHDNSYSFIFYLIDNPSYACDTLKALGLMHSSEMDLCEMLINILEEYSDPEEIVDAFDSLIYHIDTTYTVIYDEQTKSGNSAARFKAISEVGKASVQYWYEVETNSSHPWHYRYINKITTNLRPDKGEVRRWRWLKVAWADVKGFVAADNCGSATAPGGYDLGCAWSNAGNQSDSVP